MQQRFFYKFFLITSLLTLSLVLVPELPAEAQRRTDKGKLFSRKKKRSKKGFLSFLFRRGRRCPDLSNTADSSPKLSKRERRRLEKRNAEIAASANEKMWSEQLKVAEEERKKSRLEAPEPIGASTETDIEVVTVPLRKASVTATPEPEEAPAPTPAPTRTVTRTAAAPVVATTPKAAPEVEEEAEGTPTTEEGALWYTSETAVAEKTEDFTFVADDADFSEDDHELMKQLAQQYRYGFNIYLTEHLSPADISAGRVETYRRMNRIKAMLTASYGVAPDAIFLNTRRSSGSTSRIEVEFR